MYLILGKVDFVVEINSWRVKNQFLPENLRFPRGELYCYFTSQSHLKPTHHAISQSIRRHMTTCSNPSLKIVPSLAVWSTFRS